MKVTAKPRVKESAELVAESNLNLKMGVTDQGAASALMTDHAHGDCLALFALVMTLPRTSTCGRFVDGLPRTFSFYNGRVCVYVRSSGRSERGRH